MINSWLLGVVLTLAPWTVTPLAATRCRATAQARVIVSPDVSALPGGPQLQQLVTARLPSP